MSPFVALTATISPEFGSFARAATAAA